MTGSLTTAGVRSILVLVEVDQVYSQGERECQLPQFADPCFLTSPHFTCIPPLLSLNCSGNSTTSLSALMKPLLSFYLNFNYPSSPPIVLDPSYLQLISPPQLQRSGLLTELATCCDLLSIHRLMDLLLFQCCWWRSWSS